MQLSLMCDYSRVFGTVQTLDEGGPIEYLVRGADELFWDLNNSQPEIKLKITLENGNDVSIEDNFGAYL